MTDSIEKINYWEKNPSICSVYDNYSKDGKLAGEAVEGESFEGIVSYLKINGFSGNVYPSNRLMDVEKLVSEYGACCEYMGFEMGFKAAMGLLKECGLSSEINE